MNDMDKAIEEAKADMLPFESWERLTGETSSAFAAFCAYRDCGAERNIRKAVESVEKDDVVRAKKYRVWRNWSTQFRWRERAADFDRYLERLKQEELRKTIEAQGEKHRQVTGKMLDVVSKKLDSMNPAELTQGNLTEWVQTAIKAEREAAGLVSPNGQPEVKQGELNFTTDFQGL
jgi:NADPH-dependent glutamate synthase beta subunit-like oxidoreductase